MGNIFQAIAPCNQNQSEENANANDPSKGFVRVTFEETITEYKDGIETTETKTEEFEFPKTEHFTQSPPQKVMK